TQLQQRQGDDLSGRVAPGPRSGRPPTAQGLIEPLIDAVIERDPRALGSRSTVWTAPLLTPYLREAHALPVSRQTVIRAIPRLHLRWKRPRHRLGRRPATWRQAKGGSNGACEDGHGPSSSCLTRPSSRKPHHSTTATGGKGSMPNVSSMAFGAVAKYIFRMFVAVILAYTKASCALHERTGYFWSGETDASMRCGPRLVLAAPPCGWGAGGLGRSEAERIAVIRNQYQALRRVMEEKVRRRWAACAARALGWGGSTAVAAAPGRSRPTMRAGLAEVHG